MAEKESLNLIKNLSITPPSTKAAITKATNKATPAIAPPQSQGQGQGQGQSFSYLLKYGNKQFENQITYQLTWPIWHRLPFKERSEIAKSVINLDTGMPMKIGEFEEMIYLEQAIVEQVEEISLPSSTTLTSAPQSQSIAIKQQLSAPSTAPLARLSSKALSRFEKISNPNSDPTLTDYDGTSDDDLLFNPSSTTSITATSTFTATVPAIPTTASKAVIDPVKSKPLSLTHATNYSLLFPSDLPHIHPHIILSNILPYLPLHSLTHILPFISVSWLNFLFDDKVTLRHIVFRKYAKLRYEQMMLNKLPSSLSLNSNLDLAFDSSSPPAEFRPPASYMTLSPASLAFNGYYTFRTSYLKTVSRDMFTVVPVGTTILQCVCYRHIVFFQDGSCLFCDGVRHWDEGVAVEMYKAKMGNFKIGKEKRVSKASYKILKNGTVRVIVNKAWLTAYFDLKLAGVTDNFHINIHPEYHDELAEKAAVGKERVAVKRIVFDVGAVAIAPREFNPTKAAIKTLISARSMPVAPLLLVNHFSVATKQGGATGGEDDIVKFEVPDQRDFGFIFTVDTKL